jgi:hypothetical protein
VTNLQALVFVGDAMDLPTFTPASLACQYSVSGRGRPTGDPNVSRDRAADWGAHCQFDPGSARQLGELLRTVAVYCGWRAAGAFGEWQCRRLEVTRQLN